MRRIFSNGRYAALYSGEQGDAAVGPLVVLREAVLGELWRQFCFVRACERQNRRIIIADSGPLRFLLAMRWTNSAHNLL